MTKSIVSFQPMAESLSLTRVKIWVGELEPREFEAWSNRAPDERPAAEASGALPVVRRNDDLRALACKKRWSEPDDLFGATVRRDAKLKRRPGIPVPNLHRVDAMPVRGLAFFQEKVDCC